MFGGRLSRGGASITTRDTGLAPAVPIVTRFQILGRVLHRQCSCARAPRSGRAAASLVPRAALSGHVYITGRKMRPSDARPSVSGPISPDCVRFAPRQTRYATGAMGPSVSRRGDQLGRRPGPGSARSTGADSSARPGRLSKFTD